MYHVFICYPRSYFAQVKPLHDALELALRNIYRRDAQVFQEALDLQAADDWKNEANTALEEARVMIVVLVPTILESPHCRSEMLRFMETPGKHIVPLICEEFPRLPQLAKGVEGRPEGNADHEIAVCAQALQTWQAFDISHAFYQNPNGTAYKVAVAKLARMIRNKLDYEDHAADDEDRSRALATPTETELRSASDLGQGRDSVSSPASRLTLKDIGTAILGILKRSATREKPGQLFRFTTFSPTEAEPGKWHDLISYIHLPSMQAQIEEDSTRLLVETVPVRKTISKSETRMAPGTKISVIPRIPGLRINPEHIDIILEENWHRASFRIMADPSDELTEVGQTLNGAIEFLVEGLLVGRTSVSILITDAQPLIPQVRAEEATQYRAIFVSYSRDDTEIVSMLERAHRALGDTVLRDVECIRSGQYWRRELYRMIDNADVFQLFWSKAAQTSIHVEEEWRYALKKRKDGFIRPVYWRKPMASIPPDLSMLHFAFVPLDDSP